MMLPSDPIAYDRHKAIKCAEALIPSQVPAVHIFGIYVSCSEAVSEVQEAAPQLLVTINGKLFFYEESR